MDHTAQFLQTGIPIPYEGWYYPSNVDLSVISTYYETQPGLKYPAFQKQNPRYLPSGLTKPEATTYANLDALIGLSPPAPDPSSLAYRNWHHHPRNMIVIGSEDATEYFLWRNPNWGAVTWFGAVASPWYVPDIKQRATVLPEKSTLATITDAVRETVQYAIIGLSEYNSPRLFASVTAGLVMLENGGQFILRYNVNTAPVTLMELIGFYFERTAIIAPYARRYQEEYYYIASNFKGREYIQPLVQLFKTLANTNTDLSPQASEAWSEYITNKHTENVNYPATPYPEQLYGWWALPSPRWLSVVQ